MMEKPFKKTSKRVVRPHGTIANAAYHMLKHADENRRGCTLFRIGGLVLEAFAFEGYCAYLATKIPGTTFSVGRGRTKDRIKALLKVADENADFSCRPYSTVFELFQFRDMMAHPREETVRSEKRLTEAEVNRAAEDSFEPKTSWEQKATQNWVNKVRDDVKAVIDLTWKQEFGGWAFDSGFGESHTEFLGRSDESPHG